LGAHHDASCVRTQPVAASRGEPAQRQVSSFIAKVRRSLQRDSDLPVTERISKGFRYLRGTLLAPWYLRRVTSVGVRARTVGKPRIDNAGRITIGTDLNLTSSFSPVELVTAPSGSIEIADNVLLNYGTYVSARTRVTIGPGVNIGPYCVIDDSDATVDHPHEHGAAPISIGAGTWLAGRVTVLPGATIGANSVISGGSIVSGTIPDGVIARGIPARVVRVITPASQAEAS
jgi:acetyltransferase-like isoleucine patch superfamily enzyme